MISVVIVNWNGEDIIEKTISSLITSVENIKGAEIIVVDNASNDNSLEVLQSYAGAIVLLASSNNLGFAGGCNLGAIYAKNPYILFLNPDTEVNPVALNDSIRYMEDKENVSVGILGLKLVDENGYVTRSCARFPEARMFLVQNLGLDRIFPSLGHTMKEWDHLTTQKVDQVIGAFYLVRKDLFKILGGFDERFFVYFEEVDFAYRAKKLGFISVYYAGVSIYHEGEGTTNKIKAKRLFYSINSRILYGKKHYSSADNTLNLVNALALEPFSRIFFMLITGRILEIREIFTAYRMIYMNLPSTLRQAGSRGA